GENGIIYPSVRHPEGECFVAFYPDVISIPKQGKHLSLYWNGKHINKVKIYHSSGNKIFEVIK
ncbi:MAG: RES family NAD+ phosphorylase, partial [Cocleimonas sp.]